MRAQVLGLEGDPPPERVHFPGSQPVSLDRANIGLLEARRFWVTWKADGTRYLLLLCRWGVYLLDRSFAVRRVQVPARCPPPRLTRPLVAQNWPTLDASKSVSGWPVACPSITGVTTERRVLPCLGSWGALPGALARLRDDCCL